MVPRHVGASFFEKSLRKIWWKEKNAVSLHSLTRTRAFSSAGLEHLPYKQRVGGSNPSTPTSKQNAGQFVRHFSFIVIVPLVCLFFVSLQSWPVWHVFLIFFVSCFNPNLLL